MTLWDFVDRHPVLTSVGAVMTFLLLDTHVTNLFRVVAYRWTLRRGAKKS